MDQSTIKKNYMFHQPNAEQVLKSELMRKTTKELALTIETVLSDSRERTLALTKLEECLFWANAAITRHEKGTDS